VRLILVPAVGAALVAAPVFSDLADGPPPGHTGGFGEPTCAACHQPPAASRAGTLELAGLPAAYRAGEAYEITVVSASPGLTRAGFQMAVRFAPGTALAGRQAGLISTTPDPLRTLLTPDSALAIMYAHHSLEGTAVQPAGRARWTVRWTAPVSSQPVVFHVASVLASDDNSPLDDEVRVTMAVVPGSIP